VFEASGARFSSLICFEAIFPRLARQFVDGGAELLVNVTNDVWYGKSSMPLQHAAMSVMRSIENRRSLVRSANSGVSLVSDPFGRIAARAGTFERAVIIEDVPLSSRRSFYARYGDVFPWTVVLLAAVILVMPLARRAGNLH
jgi:apolipoprotein N-acyltransferase